MLRPAGRLIAMVSVNYGDEVTMPSAHEDELTKPAGTATEMKMMKALLGTIRQKRFEIGAYHDLYAERLQTLVEAKAKGKKLVATPETEAAPPVINLMDALRKSLKQTDSKSPRVAKSTAKPTKSAATRSASRKRA